MILLLAIWPAVTSHPLLEQAGVIHQVHDDHHGEGGSHEHDFDNHVFADGDYASPTATKLVQKPDFDGSSHAVVQMIALCSILLRNDAPGPAPPGNAPPQLQQSWSFLLRTALPVRAPSIIS